MNIGIDCDGVDTSPAVKTRINDEIKGMQNHKEVTGFKIILSHQPTKSKAHAFTAKIEARFLGSSLFASSTSEDMHKSIALSFLRLESIICSRKQKIESVAKRGLRHRGSDIVKAGGSLREAAGY